MEYINKIVKSFEDSRSLLKVIVREAIQNKAKEQERGFVSMLLITLGAILLGNMLAVTGINRAGERFLRANYGSSIKNKNF